MTGFLTDTFTNATGTLLTAHTGDSGAGWVAHSASPGGFTIAGNRAYGSSTGVLYANQIAPDPNIVIEVAYHYLTDAGSGYIMGRLRSDQLTAYLARQSAGNWQIFKYVNTVISEVKSAPSGTLTAGQTYMLGFVLGSNIQQLYVDGVLMVEAADADPALQYAGYVGLRENAAVTSTTGKHIDSLVASAAPPHIFPVHEIGSTHIGPLRVGKV